MATSASNLGPESIVDTPVGGTDDPSEAKTSLLTAVCQRSAAIAALEGVDGARPFCTGTGVGAVLSVEGPRDAHGNIVHPTKVVSINESCDTAPVPFLPTYEGVRVECAERGEDYRLGQLVPIRGSAPAGPRVPADAVTASGSGLDPHISVAYADLQVNRVAAARGATADQIREVVAAHTDGRFLGFIGEPAVNVLELNIDLDAKYPGKS
jgi:K+-transporting ATPase ATPase C chain